MAFTDVIDVPEDWCKRISITWLVCSRTVWQPDTTSGTPRAKRVCHRHVASWVETTVPDEGDARTRNCTRDELFELPPDQSGKFTVHGMSTHT